MKSEIESIIGETPGVAYELIIHRLTGSDPSAPMVYIQAALHADERPGVAAMHYLILMLKQAEEEGRLLGSLILVPHANPIGAAQHMYGDHMGRFAAGTRVNFNRDFPVPGEDGIQRRHRIPVERHGGLIQQPQFCGRGGKARQRRRGLDAIATLAR